MNEYEAILNKAREQDDKMLKSRNYIYIHRFHYRNKALVSLRNYGLTYACISKLVNLHPGRVRKIIVTWESANK